MNTKPIAVLAAIALLAGGCGKSTPPSTVGSGDSQSPPPIQAEPFHGQVYKSLNGKTVLTLISKDECELAEGGTTLLCKYTKPNNTLRIVTTALGTSQVVYYRFTDQGLEDNNGIVLFSAEQYAATIAKLERQQLEKEQEEERKQQKERIEKQRVAGIIASSKQETRTNLTFSLPSKTLLMEEGKFNMARVMTRNFTLTDVSLKLHFESHHTNPATTYDRVIYFSNVRKNIISQWETYPQNGGQVHLGIGSGEIPEMIYDAKTVTVLYVLSNDEVEEGFKYLLFKSAAEAKTTRDALLKAFNEWSAKFPEAVLR